MSKCEATTLKGTVCKRIAVTGGKYCSVHQNVSQKFSEAEKSLKELVRDKDQLLASLCVWLSLHPDTDYVYPQPMVLETDKIYIVGSDHQLFTSRFTHAIDELVKLGLEHKATCDQMIIALTKKVYNNERDTMEPLGTTNRAYLKMLKRTGNVVDDYGIL